jgi:hypothetical protein
MTGKEVGWDLTDFSHDPRGFKVYVDELHHHETEYRKKQIPNPWQFENILLYLVLPCHCTRQSLTRLLQWLSRRGVEIINKVTLPDRDQKLDPRFVRENIVERFRVVELDWLRPDLDLTVFADSTGVWTRFVNNLSSTAPTTQEGDTPDTNPIGLECLHLYTETNYDALKLKQIRHIPALRRVWSLRIFVPAADEHRSNVLSFI